MARNPTPGFRGAATKETLRLAAKVAASPPSPPIRGSETIRTSSSTSANIRTLAAVSSAGTNATRLVPEKGHQLTRMVYEVSMYARCGVVFAIFYACSAVLRAAVATLPHDCAGAIYARSRLAEGHERIRTAIGKEAVACYLRHKREGTGCTVQ